MADRRWVDENGEEWASEFEYRVYEGFHILGFDVRRCSREQGDTFTYASKVIRGTCMDCGSDKVQHGRTYTPDLFVSDLPSPRDGTMGVFVECKGFWSAPKRGLLRSFFQTGPDIPLLLVFQGDRKISKRSKTTYSTYAAKYLKPCGVAIYPWYRGIKLEDTKKRKLAEFHIDLLHYKKLADISAFLGDEKK